MTTKPPTLKQVYKRAASLLKRDGWTKGDFGPSTAGNVGQRCLVGAVCASLGGGAPDDRLETAYTLLRPEFPLGPIVWNDMSERTEGEVLNKLLELAKKAPAGERVEVAAAADYASEMPF